ncbi:unnamed protein product [Peniophora sp. CBMAI 1063]|nr:unnamed protein product [Peniophora sp. CBMAI 1063]
MTQTIVLPDGYFIGRKGKILPIGTDQYAVYGVRCGRHGTHVVSTRAEMLSETSGFSGAVGRGFDTVKEAQDWCDEHILAVNPRRIADLRTEADALASELQSAQSRM